MAYFERVGETAFRATEHVGGAWRTDEQHIAPAMGLLVHVVERDRDARRDDGLVLGRLTFDILGTMPVDVVDTAVTVVRAGRTIELVEATLTHGGRVAAVLRAWLMQTRDTARLAGTHLPPVPPPEQMPAYDPTTTWDSGFIASVEVRRQLAAPGRGAFWVRTPLPLVRDEATSPLARAAGLFDVANGMTVRADPREVAYPNLDLTAHLFAQPAGEWVGFDTTISFGADGIGLTSTVLHDRTGPIGTMGQVLTLRPR